MVNDSKRSNSKWGVIHREWVIWRVRRKLWQMVASAILCSTVLALCRSLGAQTPPRITVATSQGGTLSLTWQGSSQWFEVQGSRTLAANDWHPVFRTSDSSVGVYTGGGPRFFRVAALSAPPDMTVSDARRMEILKGIGDKISLLSGENNAADAQELLGLLSGYEELEGLGIAPDTSVYGRFRDGRPLIIINNRGPLNLAELESPTNTTAAAGSTPDRAAPASPDALHALATPAPTGIPDSRRAALFQGAFEDIATPMLDYLMPAFEERGYEVTGGSATLVSLLNLGSFGGDVGVFYIDSHGGVGLGLDKQINGGLAGDKGILRELPMFVIATMTEITAQNEVLYKPLADQGDLVYAFIGPAASKGIIRTGTTRPYYCITPAFVRHHWLFAKNSFVYIDTCHGGSVGAATFRQACFDQHASVYAGWTDQVKNTWAFNKATLRLFDNLLGGSPIYPAQPKQRAFDLTAVKKYMEKKGFLTDQSPNFPGAVLTFFSSGPGGFGLLAPSIRGLSTAVLPRQVYIDGLFDPDVPAMVQVQGKGALEFEVQPKDRSTVIVPWTGEQEPSAGNVTVQQRVHPSNVVPLSEWRVAARLVRWFSNVQHEPYASIDLSLHFRADVHKARWAPGEAPLFVTADSVAEPDSTYKVVSVQGMYDDGRLTTEWKLPKTVDVPWQWYFDSFGSSGFKARAILSETVVKFEVAATAKDAMTVILTSREGDQVEAPGDPAGATHSGTQGPLGPNFLIQAGDDSSAPAARIYGSRFSWQAAAIQNAPTPSMQAAAPGF